LGNGEMGFLTRLLDGWLLLEMRFLHLRRRNALEYSRPRTTAINLKCLLLQSQDSQLLEFILLQQLRVHLRQMEEHIRVRFLNCLLLIHQSVEFTLLLHVRLQERLVLLGYGYQLML
jgi:hypothetical protein